MRSSTTSTKWKRTTISRHKAVAEHETKKSDRDLDTNRAGGTEEVGSEGGTFGDVEIAVDPDQGAGSEAEETWRPRNTRPTKIVRDETGRGRRSP
jgi:hypothetical protein